MAFNLFSGAPQDQAMLALAAGLLESGGPSRLPVSLGQGASRGILSGNQAFQQAQQAQQQQQLLDLKLSEIKRVQAAEALKRQALLGLLPQGQQAQPGISPSSAAALGAPEFSRTNLPQDPAGFQQIPLDRLRAAATAGVDIGPFLSLNKEARPDVETIDAGNFLITRDKRTLREISRTPKGAAPGAIPFKFSDLSPPQARAQELAERAAGKTDVTQINAAPNAFFKSLGDKFGEQFAKRGEDARAAASSLINIREGKALLEGGTITGAGAEFIVKVGQVLQRLGVPLGATADATIANTQAFAASMGREVGNIIRLFGSGTGLSDADREYAQKVVGGQITLNEESIRRLFDINERINLAKIKGFNKEAEDILSTEAGKQIPRSSIIVPLPDGDSPRIRRFNPRTGRIE